MTEPQTHEELIAALEIVHVEAAEAFADLPESQFFERPAPEVWSAAENVVHLIKSVRAVASALRLPKLSLRVMFGAAKGSRSYAELCDVYLERLAQGGVASGPYVPDRLTPENGDEASAARARALRGWEKASRNLVSELTPWSDAALDKYRLPHPLLGKLSVREMLMFTHYHNLHHLKLVRRIAADR
ncbi:MAG: DinB family protein [Acidobacteriota bacterium]